MCSFTHFQDADYVHNVRMNKECLLENKNYYLFKDVNIVKRSITWQQHNYVIQDQYNLLYKEYKILQKGGQSYK